MVVLSFGSITHNVFNGVINFCVNFWSALVFFNRFFQLPLATRRITIIVKVFVNAHCKYKFIQNSTLVLADMHSNTEFKTEF